jgi:ABC-type molybdate transport system substrate-binding protein
MAASLLITAHIHGQTTPPWSNGRNNPATEKGLVFAVPDIDNVPDLHGNPVNAKLVLFIGGNQFFVLPRLIAGFEKLHPEIAGHIFYETLPPGILRRQMHASNTITLGNLTLTVAPDIYAAGSNVLEEMVQSGDVTATTKYATNNLEIMVSRGNAKGITGLQSLSRPDVRLAMPNPEWEGIARQIQDSLRKAGGDKLVAAVYENKVKDGSCQLTEIHHRQTPMRIMQHTVDAGVVWGSEVQFQQSIGNPIEGVPISPQLNTTAVYAAGVLRNAPHRALAESWLSYLTTEEAQDTYRAFGFEPFVENREPKSAP